MYPREVSHDLLDLRAAGNAQPNSDSPRTAITMMGLFACQIITGIGRHSQNSNIRARLARSTYVLRSIAAGTDCVHHCLNVVLAITLCCAANRERSTRSIMSAPATGVTSPVSIVFGTTKPVTKPMA